MIRDLELGEHVYYIGNDELSTLQVTHTPTKRYQRYNLRSFDHRVYITLRIDTDDYRWNYIFDDMDEAIAEMVRRRSEARIQRQRELQCRVEEWADSYLRSRNDMLRAMFDAWKSLNFMTSDDKNLVPPEDATERGKIAARLMGKYFGVDVERG